MILAAHLKSDDLPRIYVDGPFAERVDLELVKAYIGTYNILHGKLPIAFYMDEIKFKSFWGFKTEPCLVLFNTEFPDEYLKYCITLSKHKTFATIDVQSFSASNPSSKTQYVQELSTDDAECDFYHTLNKLIVDSFKVY